MSENTEPVVTKAVPNNAINSDPKKLRCAPLFRSGYG